MTVFAITSTNSLSNIVGNIISVFGFFTCPASVRAALVNIVISNCFIFPSNTPLNNPGKISELFN